MGNPTEDKGGLREDEAQLAEGEALLAEAQRGAELASTSQGFAIMLKSGGKPENVAAFFREIMAYAGRITKSVNPDGSFTRRFAMMGPFEMNGCMSICMSCFNRGFQIVEFGLMSTKAKVLAVQYGLQIDRMDETPNLDHVVERTASVVDSSVETLRKGRKIVARISSPIKTQITPSPNVRTKITVVVDDRFKNLSDSAVVSVIMAGFVAQEYGQDLGGNVQLSLRSNPRLVELLCARKVEECGMEIVSVEPLGGQDGLDNILPEKSLFCVLSELEA